MSAYYPQNSQGIFSKRAIVFIAIVLFHVLIIYAFATGLATNGARIINTILQTNIIQTQKVQELPPPPPHVDLKVPPPVQMIAPEVTITLPTTPPPITRVVQARPTPPPVIHVPLAPLVMARPTYAPDVNDYYPDVSRRNNEEGRGLAHICIDTRGRVATASVGTSTGHPMLDDAMVKLAKAYRFKPATRAGKPVEVCTSLPIKFVLTGG